MNRRTKSVLSALPVLCLMLVFIAGSFSPAFAKSKTRGVDNLKFPQLHQLNLPKIEKADLENGMKLRLIKDDKLPMVTVRAVLKGGSAYEPPTKVGIMNLLAEMLRIGGTKTVKPDDMDKILDANGISISFYSDTDSFGFTLSCLQENLDQALSLLSKMVREPIFDKEKIEETKNKMSSSISRRNDEPSGINQREFNKLIYGASSPFASQLEYEHVDNLTVQDLGMAYSMFFTPDNMLVGAVGPLEIDQLKTLFMKYFGDWNAKARIPAYPTVTEEKHDFKIAFSEKENLNQSYFSLGHLGVIEKLEDRAKLMMFNSIFAQGFSSRLMNRVRVKMGLTYGIGGGVITEKLYPGITSFSTFTKSETTIEAIKAIFDEIEIIRKEKVTTVELEDARDYFLNSFVFRYSSPARILSNSLNKEFYGIPENADEMLLADIKKVTADDILDVAQKYMTPEKIVVYVVGSEKNIKGKLSDVGKVKTIDIAIKPPVLKEKIPAATPESLAAGEKMIQSLLTGKYKGYKTFKSLKTKSANKMIFGGNTMEMGALMTIVQPDKIHMEISFMGMKIIQVINGTKGYTSQMGDTKAMTSERIEERRFADLYDVLTSKGKYTFQYLKEVKEAGNVYDVVYITDAAKRWAKFFINRDSGLVEITEALTTMSGQNGVARTLSSDFKTVKGVPIAFVTKMLIKDKEVMAITVETAEVNVKVDESIFEIKEGKKE